jgi:hypothetical protein
MAQTLDLGSKSVPPKVTSLVEPCCDGDKFLGDLEFTANACEPNLPVSVSQRSGILGKPSTPMCTVPSLAS